MKHPGEAVIDQRVNIPLALAADALRWLELLADTNPDPRLTATIQALAVRVQGRESLRRVMGW